MNPIWRDRIIIVVAAVLAVWLSFQLAEGSLGLPMLFAVIAVSAIVVRLMGQTLDAVVLGLLAFGYIVGNRGFAQLMLLPGLPLLPGEAGLAIATLWAAWRCARDKIMPWQKDSLNYALVVWILVGTARVAFDFPRFGFVALRDYATVYYAVFFFLAQQLCLDERTRRFLLRCLLFASAILPFMFALSEIFPVFFLQTLAIRGVPLVYYKGDLAPMFLGVGGVLLFLCVAGRHRWWARCLAVAMILWIFTGENRSSMLGIIVALGWIACSRFRSFALTQAAIMGLGFILLLGAAGLFENASAKRKVIGLTERAVSVIDFTGSRTYRDEGSINKTENIQFRWVWWRSVAEETLAENPVLGQGFGYDLARGFLQAYTADLGEDFSARSPHNVVITALGRMGLVGLAIFLWFVATLVRRTWRVMRDPASDATQVALWAALWPILVSACLGVVLEGPMGAVVFWLLLGMAHSYRALPSVPESSVVENPAVAVPAEPAVLPSLRPAPTERVSRIAGLTDRGFFEFPVDSAK
jgi:hypothetical protein